jgi:hypothetical protein
MKTVLLNVHLVKKNVKSVTSPQVTVSLVLEKESLHQNVTYQKKLPNQLKLIMLPLDLLKLSNVLTVVIPVLLMLPIVKLVDYTDSMPQLVNVLLVTMNQVHVKNVYNVITDVSLVICMNVKNVTIQPTDIFQTVSVKSELGIMVLLIVNHVIPNVLIVKMLLENVTHVLLTELKDLNQLVHVHPVKPKLMDIVNHVTTNVLNVKKTTPLLVTLVLILEKVITVPVQKNGTIMVMILIVNHVKTFVNNVSTPMLVPNVKNTEIITISHTVHVQPTKWIMVLKDSVMNVITDVKNVLIMKIGN